MDLEKRLFALFALSALAPLAVFAAVRPAAGTPAAAAAGVCAAAACAFFAARAVYGGLASPLAAVTSALKSFIASGYKVDAAVKRSGWPEWSALTSSLNRLMLELNAFRAFHLNQVLEDRAKAQALIETITDGVLLMDDRGLVLYSNKRALDLLGVPKSEAVVSVPAAVRVPEFRAALETITAASESAVRFDVSLPGLEEGALARSYTVISRHFKLATMKGNGRIIVLRDVTVEKEIESARETFFHMITHDMRAPLASIQGYAQMLDMKIGKDASDSDRYLQAIMRSSKRLNGMIEDILNTIKLERGDMKLNAAALEAGALCSGVFEVHDPLAARKGIKFSVAPPASPLGITGDPALLERVITNLVGNALKFTPSGGFVKLSCGRCEGDALFCVEDSGPGIPPDKREEIFKKYAQMEEHKYMGFGLGLAMCRMAVELHKGRIWVESEEGKGSKFLFTVPLAQA